MRAMSVLVALAPVQYLAVHHARCVRIGLLEIIVFRYAAVHERNANPCSIQADLPGRRSVDGLFRIIELRADLTISRDVNYVRIVG
jgi:hypothetical protein